jgi:hypothetical protein
MGLLNRAGHLLFWSLLLHFCNAERNPLALALSHTFLGIKFQAFALALSQSRTPKFFALIFSRSLFLELVFSRSGFLFARVRLYLYNKERKARTRKLELDKQNSKAEQDRQNRTGRTGRQNGTGRTDRQTRTGRTGHPERDSTGLAEQERRNQTGRIGRKNGIF